MPQLTRSAVPKQYSSAYFKQEKPEMVNFVYNQGLTHSGVPLC